ncbi:hypothetical protein P22_3590 [Propionispora sp. 2/2-37]|uniref:Spo0B domain-containing protein n=1 Tax=Propionispora sp. 2/2-37 TaxID=1677858 RepID=UPI0006BB63EC|nr:Spo0B domain-containing protein [Propionispora sp. 2/2-37]CUH97460.1 hypothetical protein P22_3590 [Propionispora sp. 2/2-37]
MADEPLNSQICEELVRLLRIQRHDFINHIQVIHAMLQLGRSEKAIQYIEDLAKDPSLLSDALSQHVKKAECKEKNNPVKF